MMRKYFNSLQAKLIASFILIIIVITGGTFIFTYSQAKKALLDTTRDDMLQIIGIASTQFSAQEINAISQLKEGQENSPEFLALVKKLLDMRALSPNIHNFYILHIEGDQVFFNLDDLAEVGIGEAYENPDEKLFLADSSPQVSDDIYSDEFGTFLSGYAPIKDENGKTAFIIGADMLATQVIERQNSVGNTIYFTLAAMALVIFLSTFLTRSFTDPIIKTSTYLAEMAKNDFRSSSMKNIFRGMMRSAVLEKPSSNFYPA
jgi:methyl-accepting chemotaxis protein